MTTGSAPTEAEIRAAIDAHARKYGWDMTCVDDFHRPFDAVSDVGEMHWRLGSDPATAARLQELIEKAEERANERVEAVMIEEAVAAALAFAREHPEAVPVPAGSLTAQERRQLLALRFRLRMGLQGCG